MLLKPGIGQTLLLHGVKQNAVALQDGLIGADLNVLGVWETATGKRRWLWIDPGFPVAVWPSAGGLAFTPDGKRLVMGRHNRVEVWELDKMIGATPEELAGPKDRPALAEPEP